MKPLSATRLQIRGPRPMPRGFEQTTVETADNAPRVAVYSRTSSASQDIRSQHQACIDYCRKRGYAVVREYIEEAHSGDGPYFGGEDYKSQPLFRHMLLEAMVCRPFDRIVCWHSDRFPRLRTRDEIKLLEALDRAGVMVEYVTDSLDAAERDSLPMGNRIEEE